MRPTRDGLGVEIKLDMCCGSEDDLDQGLDFTREEAASAVEDAVEDAGPGIASHGVDDPESGRPPSSVEAAAGAVKDYVKDEVKGSRIPPTTRDPS